MGPGAACGEEEFAFLPFSVGVEGWSEAPTAPLFIRQDKSAVLIG